GQLQSQFMERMPPDHGLPFFITHGANAIGTEAQACGGWPSKRLFELCLAQAWESQGNIDAFGRQQQVAPPTIVAAVDNGCRGPLNEPKQGLLVGPQRIVLALFRILAPGGAEQPLVMGVGTVAVVPPGAAQLQGS